MFGPAHTVLRNSEENFSDTNSWQQGLVQSEFCTPEYKRAAGAAYLWRNWWFLNYLLKHCYTVSCIATCPKTGEYVESLKGIWTRFRQALQFARINSRTPKWDPAEEPTIKASLTGWLQYNVDSEQLSQRPRVFSNFAVTSVLCDSMTRGIEIQPVRPLRWSESYVASLSAAWIQMCLRPL